MITCCSVAQPCPTLFDPIDCTMSGFPVHHYLRNLLKFIFIESVMPSNHLNLRHPLLLLPSIFPSIRDFSNESVLSMWWPKYWSFSISPSNEYSNLISFWIERENYFYILLTFITCVFSFVSFLITSFAVFHFAFVFSYFIIAFYFYERNYCLFF